MNKQMECEIRKCTKLATFEKYCFFHYFSTDGLWPDPALNWWLDLYDGWVYRHEQIANSILSYHWDCAEDYRLRFHKHYAAIHAYKPTPPINWEKYPELLEYQGD